MSVRVWLAGCVAGWLCGWLVVWLAVWLAVCGWLCDCVAGCVWLWLCEPQPVCAYARVWPCLVCARGKCVDAEAHAAGEFEKTNVHNPHIRPHCAVD